MEIKMDFGLIGYPLKHSFSKEVHSLFSNYQYEINELEESSFDDFMTRKNFKGINVTIPYKQKVIPYLDEIDDYAKEINAVNTIINTNGKLKGYNTDFFGVVSSFTFFNSFNKDYCYIILGTGATSNTIAYTLKFLGAHYVKKCYRENSKVKGDLLYSELEKDFTNVPLYIINTTPNGMYPHHSDETLIDLTKFKNLKGVMDVVYNPLKTKILQDAEKLGVQVSSGLYMLVAQAIFAGKYFLNDKSKLDPFHFYPSIDYLRNGDLVRANKICGNILTEDIFSYYDICRKNKLNIVLTGMPTCGKSTLGKEISKKYNYDFIDTDELIENRINMKVSDYIKSNGEAKFRDIESDIIKEIATRNHVVISTGGGVVLRDENITNLKYNGKIFFINRSLELLKPSDDRPLTSNQSSLTKKYNERLPIYKKTCDIEINGDNDYTSRINDIFANL